MTTVYTRASKGSALTWAEGDANITNLNTDKIELTDLSVSTTTASSGGSLTYNNTTGAFTFAPADLSGLGGASNLDDLSDVTITTPSANQVLTYNGTTWINQSPSAGALNDLSDVTAGTPSNGQVLVYNGSTFQWENQTLSTGATDLDGLSDVQITTPSSNQVLTYNGTTWINQSPSAGALDDLSDVTVTTPANGQALVYNSGTFQWTNQTISAGIANVVEDTTPQLGGELDGQGNTVSNVNLKDYKETNYALSYASTITPDVSNGNVQTVTLTGNVTFSAFSNPEAGQSLTLIVKQDATGSRTLTSTMKFAGASKTLSTAANSIDIISVFYDGTNYYASLAKGFA